MKLFLLKGLAFFLVVVMVLGAALLYIPDRVVNKSLLGALPDKHEQLSKMPSPKIVFVGGSNTSFGLDTKRISDAFNMPAYNMGIQVSLGLRYTLNDIKKYVHEGDILVVMPEYIQFSQNFSYGRSELIPVLFDIYPEGRKQISLDQWLIVSKYIPNYAAVKLKNTVAFSLPETVDAYSRNSFNEYGDSYIHWNKKNEAFPVDQANPKLDVLDKSLFRFIAQYKADVESLGARMFILPPAFQEQSFRNNTAYINEIENAFEKINSGMLAKAERYEFPDSLMFDSPSHLNRKGVDIRTSRVISDLSKVLQK